MEQSVLADFILLFNSAYFLLPITLAVLASVHRYHLLHLFPLYVTSVFFNRLLKELFQKPLPEWLSQDGYSLPSGHMQSAIVFWGGIFLFVPLKWRTRLAIPLLCLGFAWGMLARGYHDEWDLLAGAAVGGALLYGHYAHYRRSETPPLAYYANLYALCITICTIIGFFQMHVFVFSWILYGVLLSVALTVWGVKTGCVPRFLLSTTQSPATSAKKEPVR